MFQHTIIEKKWKKDVYQRKYFWKGNFHKKWAF